MMTLEMTAQFAPMYWATIALLAASASGLVIAAWPHGVARVQARLSDRRDSRTPRLFVPGAVAKASA